MFEKKILKKQVEKKHYEFDSYVGIDRWDSYFYQINETTKCKGDSVLLIGIGDGIVCDILKKLGKDVTTFDFDESLNPDIVGDVTKIDQILNKKYDTIICCQVLEHIPFEIFEPTIKKISEIANEQLILSLPNKNIWIKLWFYAPIIKNIILKTHFRIFWQNKRDLYKDGNGEHYREIDATNKWKLNKIINILKKYFNIQNFFIPISNTYHMFRILHKKK